MKFSQVRGITIPNGGVRKISISGNMMWDSIYGYVSLGDSIAAGHAINDDWEKNYGKRSQYGENGNTETVIVPNTYTDRIRTKLNGTFGANNVYAKSFAHSGDSVGDDNPTENIFVKLDQQPVKDAIAEADLVTLSIGANNILGEVNDEVLTSYINEGRPTLVELGDKIDTNLSQLRNTLYKALFDKLKSINPNAKYMFTTIYNPYKYLWLDEGKNGFFGDFLNAIPQLTILWIIEVDELIKEGLLNTSAARTLFDRVNGLGNWVEGYVVKLNQVLTQAIAEYNDPNFVVVDSKSAFEVFPDRPISASIHYNDLVNVQFTRGYQVGDMHYGRLWADSSIYDFYFKLATKHATVSSGLDIDGFTTELFALVVEKVIVPELDPHPRTYGHEVIYNTFGGVLNLQ